MKYTHVIVVAILLICVSSPVRAEKIWTAEIFGGLAYNFKTPLTIRQLGEEEIRLTANYKTRASQNAPYYVLRIGHRVDNRAWEFEHIHHKIFLTNTTPEVELFQIEHGFNLFTLNRALYHDKFILRIGAGIAVTRAINIVRGKLSRPDTSGFFTDYRLTGGGMQLAIERRFYFGGDFFVGIEGKLTAALVHVDIVDGRATVPNVAIHGLFGFGSDF